MHPLLFFTKMPAKIKIFTSVSFNVNKKNIHVALFRFSTSSTVTIAVPTWSKVVLLFLLSALVKLKKLIFIVLLLFLKYLQNNPITKKKFKFWVWVAYQLNITH